MPTPDPTRTAELCFETRALTKIYGAGESAVHALRGVDLDLPERELVVLLGASGSGKSTLLNILGGLDRATSGQLFFRGNELTTATQRELTDYRRRHVGFVFQFYNLMASLTTRENVALVTEIAENPMQPEEALELVGLRPRLDHFPAQLSGGEQQRVAIARDREAALSVALRRADRRTRQRNWHPRARSHQGRQRHHGRDDATDYAQRRGRSHGRPGHHVLGRRRARDATQPAPQVAEGAVLVKRFAMPRLVSALDRKLLRDLWHMKGQALAIAFVVAGGAAVALVAAGMLSSLDETRRAYYERYRFGDVWAPVVRAPNSLIADIRSIPGVLAAETRVRAPALFDMPGMEEPATGEIFSLPASGEPSVNQIYLERGRLPRLDRRDEAVVIESFATAHDLVLGDTIAATIYGGRETVTVVGIALSPEHVYAIAPGQLVPDQRLFGVLWMGREALAEHVNQDGAFNEAVVRVSPGSSEAAVISALDELLEAYGASGAYGRDEQISDAFISSELDQLRTMGSVLPPIFLLVAAFLVNVVISRLIATERAEIGLMKAFGYSDVNVAAHYLKAVAAIGVIGIALGSALGLWMGRAMAGLYTEYYRFPFLVFKAEPSVFAVVIGVTVLAVGGGAVLAVRRAARLNPATAMTPPPPPDYSKALGARVVGWRALDQQTRMILRQIVRFPSRAAFTTIGVAVSGALLVGTLFFIDAMEEMMATYFEVANRHDMQVTFVEPRSRSAYFELERAPSVLDAEPYRSVAVRLKNGHHEGRTALMGLPLDARLSRLVDADLNPVVPPPGGLVLSRDLAENLDIDAGDPLEIEVTEGRRPTLVVPVAAIATTYIGSGAHMRIEDLNALMREGAAISGANLTVDAATESALYAKLKDSPAVAGVALQGMAERNFRRLMDQNIGLSIWIYTGFAGLIAIGVVYNSVRISFAERARELASLRVLGFTRGEVSYILLGEIAFLTLLALPIGAALGTGLAYFLAQSVSSDLFRLPFVIEPSTYGYAAAVVIVVTAVSGLLVRRQLDRMDLVGVLKSKD